MGNTVEEETESGPLELRVYPEEDKGRIPITDKDRFKDDLYTCGIDSKLKSYVKKSPEYFENCIRKAHNLNTPHMKCCEANRLCIQKHCYWSCGPTIGNKEKCHKCALNSKCKPLYQACTGFKDKEEENRNLK